jgi:hypothetical protein
MNSRLRDYLARTRNPDGGWPYLAGRQSRLEPTCWALLALEDADAAKLVGSWQNRSGLVIEPSSGAVNYAFNGLAAVALGQRWPAMSAAIAAGLIARKGIKVAEHPAIKQNSSLQGWSWYDETFSWVEPTAWCMLALKKHGRNLQGTSARIDEAERLMADRACQGGGWNYGNTEVYGKHLYPHVPPTALGILAMQDRVQDSLVTAAVSVLTREAPREGSSVALALAWLALTTVKAPTADLAQRLEQRVDTALSVGNISAIAMTTFVLGSSGAALAPAAFRV